MQKFLTEADEKKIQFHKKALEDLGYVVIVWTVDDMPASDLETAQDRLMSMAGNLEDRCIEAGNNLLDEVYGFEE